MEKGLKYVVWVVTVAFRAMECFFNVYGYAKDRSGPLKPVLETVEGTAKSVAAPLYNKFNDVQIEALKFVTMDESLTKIGHLVPPTLKEASSKVMSIAQQAPKVAQNVASEVQYAGLKGSVFVIVKYLFAKYELKAEKFVASVWHKLNQLPIFPHVAQVILPVAAYCTEKYNKIVRTTAEKGYKVSSYLPLVPTERIAKVFSKEKIENQLPVVPHVEQTILSTAAYCTEKYNETMQATVEKGFKVASNLPLDPTKSIAKVFGKDKFKI